MKYYISFGQAHAHRLPGISDTFDKDCLCEIETETQHMARDLAFEAFGNKWSFLYPEDKLQEVIGHFPRGIVKLR